ncbi:MAG: tRNA (cytidine(34)-2'-O)-methyltransferase [Pseudomonadota bacterium]
MGNDKQIGIALFQPDIPQNVGAAMRLCACMGVPLDIIEPCGFPWDQKKIKQAGMDYVDQVTMQRHDSWKTFKQNQPNNRLILLTTKTDQSFFDFEFQAGDILIAGQESSGAPDYVHQDVDARVTIPMNGQARSMNVINATAMILSEALRQTK